MRQHPIFKLICDRFPQWLYARLLGERWRYSCLQGHEWHTWRVPYSAQSKCPICGEWPCSGGSRPSDDLLSRIVKRIHSEAYMRALDEYEAQFEAAEKENRQLQNTLDLIFEAAVEGRPAWREMGYNALLSAICERLASGGRPLRAGDPSPPELWHPREWEALAAPADSLIVEAARPQE